MNIIYAIGAFNAVVIGGLGLIGAGVTLMGKDAKTFWDRVVPACGILVGTSAAAGVVMGIARWLAG